MTPEEEEDVIKIDQAEIAPCGTPPAAPVLACVACVIVSSNTLARSSQL